MTKEYIERGALLEILENQGHADIDDVLNITAADVVQRTAYDQVVWERDLALSSINYLLLLNAMVRELPICD